jgi:hypothetical protein
MTNKIAPLQGIPLIHQPNFDDTWNFHEYSEEINDLAVTLNRDGFAIFDYPEPNFDKVVEVIKNKLNPRYEWDKWRSGEKVDLRIQDAWSFCDEVKVLAANKKVLEILSVLYGRRAFPFQTLNFGVGTQQAGHSDHVHFHSIPENFMCGVWIALEDVDEQNGALFYYPGSQNWIQLYNEHLYVNPENNSRETLYAHYPRFTDTWQMLAEHYKVKPKVAALKKGQAVIWTSSVVHGGGRILNKTRTRWSQVTHYFFDDCVYTTPLANTHAKGKVLVRDITDISTGRIVQNKVCGVPLTEEEIDHVTPKPFRTRNIHEVMNIFVNSPYKNHKDLPRGFDALSYLKKNPDVLEAGSDPYEHYVTCGKNESRIF